MTEEKPRSGAGKGCGAVAEAPGDAAPAGELGVRVRDEDGGPKIPPPFAKTKRNKPSPALIAD